MTDTPFRCCWALLLSTVAFAETVRLREPGRRDYDLVPEAPVARAVVPQAKEWLTVQPRSGGRPVEFGRRLVVRFRSSDAASAYLKLTGGDARLLVDDRTVVVSLPTPIEALRAAASLAAEPEVEFARPSARSAARRHFAYAAAPNDRFYPQQDHLDPAEPASGTFFPAATLNARGAWAVTRGEDVVVGVGDDGIDQIHADLAANLTALSHNFFNGSGSGAHMRSDFNHGTAVAGLIAARGDNGVGISGVAPHAGLASLVLWNADDLQPDDAGLASVFAFRGDAIAVQNHSWGNSEFLFLEMPAVQSVAISNAVTGGREGRGVVFVRSAGNTRVEDYGSIAGVGDANLDAYANDLLQITVGAVRSDGRVTSYSNPGACLLVAAPGGDETAGFAGLFTTDPTGAKGKNRFVDPGDPQLADYISGANGFVGTSGAAPLISGVAALVLSANPQLGWRDVQQVFALSARQVDRTDPDLATNGAGWRVSHNTGFGVVNAGTAVRLAQTWSNRPPAVRHRYLDTNSTPIPDEGFRVLISGEGVPEALRSLPATGGTGRYPDAPTAEASLVDVGSADTALAPLAGAAALVRRGGETFAKKLGNCANAGAPLAVIANNTGSGERVLMLDTDFTRIPAAAIGANDGAALRALVATNASVRVRLALDSVTRTFAVNDPLLVEHVRLRVRWQHARQGDLRVTLRSPAGTVSVLHRPGVVNEAPLTEWTYGSTHHLGESSLGEWTLAVTDIGLAAGSTGTLDEAALLLDGVPITDTDADGLDDDWERNWFAGLDSGPRNDPDGDGWNNAAEQLRGSNPTQAEDAFAVDLTLLPKSVRASWPALDGSSYEVFSAATAEGPWSLAGSVSGQFPEGAFHFVPGTNGFFRVRREP